MSRKTKIVCTLGPASSDASTIRRLLAAGMDVARLNFSHGTHAQHAARIQFLRQAAREAGRELAILADLCGPKIRIGQMADGVFLRRGQSFRLINTAAAGGADFAPFQFPRILAALKPSDPIFLNDGLLRLRVESASSKEAMCKVLIGGPLTSNKGVTLPQTPLKLASITDKDKKDLVFALSQGVDIIALSFVRSAKDASALRALLPKRKPQPLLVAKIELAVALERLDGIIAAFDGTMVARGDLGVQIPIERVPEVQKKLIHEARLAKKPVIVATQMLESMTQSAQPTRAEVTDVANAVLDGADALMLSGETASGNYPVQTTRTMSKIVQQAESMLDYEKLWQGHSSGAKSDVTQAVACGAVEIARDLEAAAIITFTESGYTAKLVSSLRPRAPIVAATPKPDVARQLRLSWGVQSYVVAEAKNTDEVFNRGLEAAKMAGVRKGGRIVLTAGTPIGKPGSTNLIRVTEIG